MRRNLTDGRPQRFVWQFPCCCLPLSLKSWPFRYELTSMPVIRTHEAVVCGVPTKFVLTKYTNRLFVIATQTDNLGTLVRQPKRTFSCLPTRLQARLASPCLPTHRSTHAFCRSPHRLTTRLMPQTALTPPVCSWAAAMTSTLRCTHERLSR